MRKSERRGAVPAAIKLAINKVFRFTYAFAACCHFIAGFGNVIHMCCIAAPLCRMLFVVSTDTNATNYVFADFDRKTLVPNKMGYCCQTAGITERKWVLVVLVAKMIPLL